MLQGVRITHGHEGRGFALATFVTPTGLKRLAFVGEC